MRSIGNAPRFLRKARDPDRKRKILERNLRQTRVNLDELTMHLREKDIFDLTTVKYAILETNGQLLDPALRQGYPPTAKDLGVRVPEARLPVTLITGGKLLQDNLSLVGLSEQELSPQTGKSGLHAQIDPCSTHSTPPVTAISSSERTWCDEVFLDRHRDLRAASDAPESRATSRPA